MLCVRLCGIWLSLASRSLRLPSQATRAGCEGFRSRVRCAPVRATWRQDQRRSSAWSWATLREDTGPLVAALDADDSDHERCLRLLETHRGRLLVPGPVLTEVAGYSSGNEALRRKRRSSRRWHMTSLILWR
jgi:hypothetical protein